MANLPLDRCAIPVNLPLTVFSPADGSWTFRPGPLFANVLLVDEINRASPRTQAALLEPMEERQVSVDGATFAITPNTTQPECWLQN